MSEVTVDSNPAQATAAPTQDPIDLRQLGQSLQQLLTESESEDQATDSLIRLAGRLTRSRAIVFFGEDSTGELSATPSHQIPSAVAESTLNKLYSLGLMARQTATVQIARTEQTDNGVALAVPVLRPNQSSEVMVVVADGGDDLQRRLAGLVQATQFIAAFAGQWRGRFAELKVNRQRASWIASAWPCSMLKKAGN